jgi:hypothetical protein
MRNSVFVWLVAILSAVPSFAQTSKSQSKPDRNAIVITFKDGHQQTYDLADVAKIEFNTSQQASLRSTMAGTT